MALGDSITVGVGASSRYCAYPWLIKQRLLNQYALPNDLKVIARSGWTSTALMTALFSQSPERIRQANVIIIWIGGDDLVKAGRAILGGKNANMIPLVLTRYTMVRGIKQIGKARIILCTQYNPFPHSSIAINGIQALNQITKETAACYCTDLAPIHTAFTGREANLIYGYHSGKIEDVFEGSTAPIHPNNKGQRVAADVIYPLIKYTSK